VTFRYDADGEPVIDGIRLTLEARGLYAVMGANGSGKTTLLKLAMGLYAPDDGRVLIDGADIGQFSRRDLTKWIGYVPQEIRLFSGSIRDNISAAHPDAPDEDVIGAAKLAGVHDFIAALAEGYGTDVGDGGASLPGGIRQKIGIARAVLGQPPVILMDEPSSNLDRDSETALAETLRGLAADHTIVMATHSLRLLSACHSILVLERGKISTGGPADKILPELFPAAASGAVAAGKEGGA
jgi:ATP-binding cassette, subfamily C, bacterial LapB